MRTLGTLLLPLSLLTVPVAMPVAAEPLPVVASFSILADMVREVGGDRVTVRALVGPDGDAHVYQPTPADAQAVAGAGLLVLNGLAFDGWAGRLAEAAGYKGPVALASAGVKPLSFDEEERHDHAVGGHEGHDEREGDDEHGDHDDDGDHDGGAHHHEGHEGHDHGPLDPHAWQDLGNGVIYVANIARALSEADPAGAESYAANARAYTAAIEAADAQVRALLAPIPQERRVIVTSHDALGYFGHAYGLDIEAPQGLSTEAEASAAGIAGLIRQIRQDHVPAVFLENVSDPRVLERIASETGARVGGVLHSDALSAPGTPAGTYIGMVLSNAQVIAGALAP